MSDLSQNQDLSAIAAKAISQPLVTHIYTADPSARVFEDKIYVYPSHDIDAGIAFNDNGDHFGMQDYHVLRMDSPQAGAVDCGVALHVRDVPWAERQMWAPDADYRNGTYYLYFPDGANAIGVAVSSSPTGPFTDPLGRALVSRSTPNANVQWLFDPGVSNQQFGRLHGGKVSARIELAEMAAAAVS